MPQNGIDPINAGVHVYLGLQELIARECAPGKEVTLTIGQFQSGTANNVIPETAVLQGTLRTFDNFLRQHFIQRIDRDYKEYCLCISRRSRSRNDYGYSKCML